MKVFLLAFVLLSAGCALAPLVIEKIVTVGVGVWGVSEHQDRKKEMEAIKERVEQIEQVKAIEDFPLP